MAIGLTKEYRKYLVSNRSLVDEIEKKVVPQRFLKKFHKDYLNRRSESSNSVVYFKNDYHFCSFRTKEIIDLVFQADVKNDDYLVFRSICRSYKKKCSRMDVTICIMEKGRCDIKKSLNKRGFPLWANVRTVLEVLNRFNPSTYLKHYEERKEILFDSDTNGFKNEWNGVAHLIKDIRQILSPETHLRNPFFNVLFALIPSESPGQTDYEWDMEEAKCRTNFIFYVSSDNDYSDSDTYYSQFVEKNDLVGYDNGTECCPP